MQLRTTFTERGSDGSADRLGPEVIQMPQSAWSDKRERQYEHIKESELDQGRSPDRAEEIAARTVNKQRAEAGETKSARRRRTGS
jgi:plasmid stabilization system protein ParE